MAARSRAKAGPQPSLAPVVMLASVAAGGIASWFLYPGVAALWIGLIVSAWIEPAAILTGKKDSSGYPTPAHAGEQVKLDRYRIWRYLKFRLILPNSDWLPGWPVLASWVGAVLFAATAACLPVKQPILILANALGGFIAFTQYAGARRDAAGPDCPGVRLDTLKTWFKAERSKAIASCAGGLVLAVAASIAISVAVPKVAVPHKMLAIPVVALLIFGLVVVIPWRAFALADWRALTAARAEWAPRWEMLKQDPPPQLIAHEILGPIRVDTFAAPAHLGASFYWPLAPKLAPMIGAGMKIAVLEVPDEGPDGPIMGTRHPAKFKVATMGSHEIPTMTDPTLDPAIVEVFAHCAMVWTLEPLGYGRPVPIGVEKVTKDETESAAWASQWAWPGGPDLGTVRRLGVESFFGAFGCDVLIDGGPQTADILYFGDLSLDGEDYQDEELPKRLAEVRTEDEWHTNWASVLKQGVNTPSVHHPSFEVRQLADGTEVTRRAFVVLRGEDPLTFQRLESRMATTLNGANFVAITGWPGRSDRAGERHPQAFALYVAKKAIPATLDGLDEAPASQWIIAGKINGAFDACKIPRPEVVVTRCLTGAGRAARRPVRDRGERPARPPRDRREKRPGSGNIWEISLRLYDGVTLSHVRSSSERLRQALGVPWLRVADAPDGCIIYAGTSPEKAVLYDNDTDGPLLKALDWEQAWLDAKLIGAGGQLPRLLTVDVLPNNTDVSIIDFSLPPGLDISMVRAAIKKLETATGNEYVEVRTSKAGPSTITVLTCIHNPMPEMERYPFDDVPVVQGIPFATGIEGEPVAWDYLAAPHVLHAGTSGSGKAGTLTSRLPVPVSDRFPDGWATIGTLAIGDKVLSRSGEETTVWGLSPIETVEVFEVVFSDGQVVECGPDHLWTVSSAAGRHAWADRNVIARDAATLAAEAKADRIRAVAASLPPGMVATRDHIAKLAGVSGVTVGRVGRVLDHLAVPFFVETTKACSVYDMNTVLDYMLRVADAQGHCTVLGLRYDRALIETLTLRDEWLSVRDFASALLGRNATRTEVMKTKYIFGRTAPARRPGFARQVTHGYPAGELMMLVADRLGAYIGGRGDGVMPLEDVVSTRDMFATQRTTNSRDESNYAIRLADPYDPDEIELALDPYVLGVWLGDGSSGGGTIAQGTSDACTDVDTLTDQAFIIAQLIAAGLTAHPLPSAKDVVIGTIGLSTKLRAVGVLNDKHIPATYLRGSYKQRLALLQGLMDTDGSIDPFGTCELSLCDERLATDAHELIRSLGIKSSIRTSPATITEADPDKPGQKRLRVTGTRWRMVFTTTEQTFRLPRKACRVKTETRLTQDWLYVTEIRRTGRMADMRCLQVDSADHTYLTGGFVPTHNSAGAQVLLYGAALAGFDMVIIDPTKGAADFAFMKDHALAIIGADSDKTQLDHIMEAAATMKALYAEGMRRKRLNSSAGVGSYRELAEPPRPTLIFIDEFAALLGLDKVQRQPLDDPDLERERLATIAMNTAKMTVGQLTSKIAAEARAWGIHMMLGTQKLSAKMLDDIPNGSNLKVNLARILLGKTSQGDRMSALRVPDEAPGVGEIVPKGRGIWEPLDSGAVLIQNWFATQSEYKVNLDANVAPLAQDRFLDIAPFMPKGGGDEFTDGLGPTPEQVAEMFANGGEAAPGEAVVELHSEFSLDDLETSLEELEFSLDDLETATEQTPVPESDPAPADPSELDWTDSWSSGWGDHAPVATEPPVIVTEPEPIATEPNHLPTVTPAVATESDWPDWSASWATPAVPVTPEPAPVAEAAPTPEPVSASDDDPFVPVVRVSRIPKPEGDNPFA